MASGHELRLAKLETAVGIGELALIVKDPKEGPEDAIARKFPDGVPFYARLLMVETGVPRARGSRYDDGPAEID
jgi:hypothetical protein